MCIASTMQILFNKISMGWMRLYTPHFFWQPSFRRGGGGVYVLALKNISCQKYNTNSHFCTNFDKP